MSTDTQVNTISGTLASDPARWSEYMDARNTTTRMAAEREIVATASAVLGNHARIVCHHNTSGVWAVDIERGQGKRVYHLYWSSVTTNGNGSNLITIRRGEALTTLLHELFHVLYTDWVERPEWCHPAHWQDFFSILNMTEDVRIEDAGELEVPVFASLRKIENERLMHGNEAGYPTMDSLRHVALALYASRCVAPLAGKFVGLLNEEERKAFDSCLADFHWACDQRSTQALLDQLEPVYEALLPFLPPVGGGGGGGGEQPGDDEQPGEESGGQPGEEPGEQPGGNGGEQAGTNEQPGSNGGEEPGEESGDDEQPGEESGDDEQPGEESGDDEGGSGGDDAGGGGSGTRDGGVTGGDGAPPESIEEPVRPDRARGDWDTPRPDASRASHDNVDTLIDGSFISCVSVPMESSILVSATNVASRAIRSQLNRVLQYNADGSYAGRKRRGSFDVNSARRLSLGDTRVFRTKQGPRGSRDFSLVMLLDASSSVRGTCGLAIANAGYAIKRASEQVHGLDVAVAAYGGVGPIGGIPFDATDAQWRSLPNICQAVTGGQGGGTDETGAIIWARRASERRGAEQPLIIVLTDGHPNDGTSVRYEIDEARKQGIVTGGIGITRRPGMPPVVPDYHEFYATARDLSVIPSVLADLLRTMMKAR